MMRRLAFSRPLRDGSFMDDSPSDSSIISCIQQRFTSKPSPVPDVILPVRSSLLNKFGSGALDYVFLHFLLSFCS